MRKRNHNFLEKRQALLQKILERKAAQGAPEEKLTKLRNKVNRAKDKAAKQEVNRP